VSATAERPVEARNSSESHHLDIIDTTEVPFELYTDGGNIGPNPSPHGGTFAWCQVVNGERVREASGIVLPEQVGLAQVSNNAAEIFALIHGIEELPPGWQGRVSSDSNVALCWMFSKPLDELSKAPEPIRVKIEALRKSGKLSGISYRLLQGHPTKEDLERGIGRKRNRPVSVHNVHCDALCTAKADWFKASEGLE